MLELISQTCREGLLLWNDPKTVLDTEQEYRCLLHIKSDTQNRVGKCARGSGIWGA